MILGGLVSEIYRPDALAVVRDDAAANHRIQLGVDTGKPPCHHISLCALQRPFQPAGNLTGLAIPHARTRIIRVSRMRLDGQCGIIVDLGEQFLASELSGRAWSADITPF